MVRLLTLSTVCLQVSGLKGRTLFLNMAKAQSSGLLAYAKAFWNHPAGPKTIHFWAPTFKWGISIANIADFKKPPDAVSYPQQVAVTATGVIWSRFSTQITPVRGEIDHCFVSFDQLPHAALPTGAFSRHFTRGLLVLLRKMWLPATGSFRPQELISALSWDQIVVFLRFCLWCRLTTTSWRSIWRWHSQESIS
jgi:mitochondrial pyruvate carrier 2